MLSATLLKTNFTCFRNRKKTRLVNTIKKPLAVLTKIVSSILFPPCFSLFYTQKEHSLFVCPPLPFFSEKLPKDQLPTVFSATKMHMPTQLGICKRKKIYAPLELKPCCATNELHWLVKGVKMKCEVIYLKVNYVVNLTRVVKTGSMYVQS